MLCNILLKEFFLTIHDDYLVLAHVASNLKRLRNQHDLSQQALADQSGISRRMIAGLENGQANISLAKLSQLAEGLGVSFANLVSPPDTSRTVNHNILTWRGTLTGSEAWLSCSVSSSSQVELWIWHLAPQDSYQAESDPPGWFEMIHVIKGTLTLELTNGVQELMAGQSFSYNSDQPYRYVNNGNEPLHFVRNVIGPNDSQKS
jgi:transcriptional regulator with XRE-family HTH domain